MNRCLLVLLSTLLVPVPLRAQESALPVLTLEDAVRIVQENNRSIKSADLAASISGDHGRRHGAGAVSAGHARRTAVGAVVLFADRWVGRGYFYYPAARAGVLQHFCA